MGMTWRERHVVGVSSMCAMPPTSVSFRAHSMANLPLLVLGVKPLTHLWAPYKVVGLLVGGLLHGKAWQPIDTLNPQVVRIVSLPFL